MRFLHFLALFSLAGLLAGCPTIDPVDDDDSAMDDDDSATDDDDDDADPLELIGDYVDDWGFEHQVREDSWTFDPAGTPSIVWLSQYDNEEGWVIGQNDPVDSFNPDLWSKFVWHWEVDVLHMCQTAFSGVDEAAALATTADTSDLATGCGGYAWSILTEAR